MKYNIIISAINLESVPYSATGTCDSIEFEARTIFYNGGLIWKVVENGMCPAPVDLSAFTRGQRASIARWLKMVEQNVELVDKSSQASGSTSSGTSRNNKVQELQAQNNELMERLAAMEAMLAQLAEK
tara:strand:+ start:1398 stop:1781 length:384 start_codon:yes stop_codon:yes gene_type:complete